MYINVWRICFGSPTFWITYLNNFRHKLFYFLNDFGTGARYRWYRSPELLSGGRVTRGTGILPRFQGEGYAWNLRINVYPLSILLSFWQRIFYPCKCKSYDWNLVIKQIWFYSFYYIFILWPQGSIGNTTSVVLVLRRGGKGGLQTKSPD